MNIFIDLTEDNVVDGWGTSHFNINCIEIEIPEDHDIIFSPLRKYKYINEELIERDQQEIDDEEGIAQPTEQERLGELENAILLLMMGD